MVIFREIDFIYAQCGKIRNSLPLKKNSSNQLFSNFFGKTIAFTKFLRKNCERERIFVFFHTVSHTVEITEFHCHSFSANFSSNQRFTKELYWKLVWRKKIPVAWQWISRFSTLCAGTCENYGTLLPATVFFCKISVKSIFLLKNFTTINWFDGKHFRQIKLTSWKQQFC